MIEQAVEYVDLTSIMSKYNIDMATFVDNNNTRIHTYYRARMLHAAILAELLPNGHDAVRQKFASIQLLNTVNTDSYTLLNELRYQLNRIKAEISLTVNTQEYPNYMWIDAFIDRIRCPTYSKTINALENVMVEHARTPLDFNEFMENVINYVQVTTNIGSITAMPSGHTVTQNVIQLAQTKDEVSATCSFCLEVKKTVYPNIKVSHPTEACRRKTWSCPHCGIQMNKPALFHYASDCTKIQQSGKRPRDPSSNKNKKEYPNKKESPYRKVMLMQTSDNESDSDSKDSDDDATHVMSTVKVNKRNTYSALNDPMLLDTGANQNTIPPHLANNLDYPKKHDRLCISGIGQLRLTTDHAITICGIDHYLVSMQEGIISISQLCQKFDIKAIFSKSDVKFTNADMSIEYATGYINNGLYVIPFAQYLQLLHRLSPYDSTRINAAQAYRISHQIEKYIKQLHAYMGHASPTKMTDTIRSGITIPEPDKYDSKLHNTELLCKMITKYYAKTICIACKIIQHRRLLHQPNITLYPTIPMEEVTFDFKPSDIESYDGNKGTFIASCMATMYTMQYPVRSSKQTLQALKYFIQVANSFGFKLQKFRYDAAGSNNTSEIQQYLNTRGIRGIPVAVGRQCRNLVEKVIDKIFKTYHAIQASQCLLNITYWPRGLDTAISYNNMMINSRCPDITPHEVLTKQKPRIQSYAYGQPVLINRQRKHFQKEFSYQHQNLQAIVIQIDNTNSFGVKVISCLTGKVANGYYDMIGTIDFDLYDISQRREMQQRYAIKEDKDPVTCQLPLDENAFHFIHMDQMINETYQEHYSQMNTENLHQMPPTADDTEQSAQEEHTRDHLQSEILDSSNNAQVMQLCQIDTSSKITPHLQIQSDNNITVLQDEQYARLQQHERKPQWHKIRHLEHQQQWINVAREEIEKLDAHDVGEVVSRINVPAGIQIIPTTLVLNYKKILQEDGKWGFKPRARLAGRGDLEKNHDDEDCYAPTTYISTILTLLAIAVQQEWTIATFDVVGAFLKTPTTEELYISLPGDILPAYKVIKLHKYLYGLKKANNKFNEHFHHLLIAFGLQTTSTDMCLYHNSDIRLAIFVDDGLLIARDPQVRDKLLQYLDNCIGIESHLEPKQYLKLEFIISPGRILIHQRNYILQMWIAEPSFKTLHKFMKIKYTTKHPIPNNYDELRKEYVNSIHCTHVPAKIVQEIVGTLVYVIYNTRGDMQIVGHYLSKHQSKPTEYDLFMSYNTYLYLKADPYKPLIFSKSNKFELSLISDGAHMKHVDVTVRGQLGFFITLGHCTIMVQSTAAHRPTRSATETEIQAGGNGLAQISYLLAMLSDLSVQVDSVNYFTDSLSGIKLINRRQQLSKKARHFANDIAQFKHAVFGNMHLQIHFTPTEYMSADTLTKLNIPVTKKHKFSAEILNPSLFFQAYQHYINCTNKVFKKVRFTDKESEKLDDDPTYVNEIYNE